MKTAISGPEALANAKRNLFRNWSRSPQTEVSIFPEDASNRIFDGYAQVVPAYHGPRFSRDARVFAMGSCFAREIGRALVSRGGEVISLDETVNVPAFQVDGDIRTDFFHRFTPRAMLQEFQASFADLEGWDEQSLIFPTSATAYSDIHYWRLPNISTTLEDTVTRRKIAQALVRKVATADIVILTLGLTESWIHQPTGFHVNCVEPRLVTRSPGDFTLHQLDFQDVQDCLRQILETIKHHHETGNFRLFVTVSPVPLTSTFTADDIIVANSDSKSTLRAAARQFSNANDQVSYFPSYEIVNYSNHTMAWKQDRIHIKREMVDHIVETFIDTAYAAGSFSERQ